MAKEVYIPNEIEEHEPYFAFYVWRTRMGYGETIAELQMDLIGPVTPDVLEPKKLNASFWLANDLLALAKKRAVECGVSKILIIDPYGWIQSAPASRYG
jgi:hypothetical protein